MSASAGCGGAQQTAPTPLMASERLVACQTLSIELQTLDPDTAPEPELVRLMETADRDADLCRNLYLADARTPGETALAEHRGRQLSLSALEIELTLSTRFDRQANLCAIVADTFTELLAAIGGLEEALGRDDVADAERAQLEELHQLDMQAVEVLVVTQREFCEQR
ncbi:MAG: hypothetical protein H6697_02780 [Myxococcales bacterium]|nr:hypothetical protein [Myxococcales bacterium]